MPLFNNGLTPSPKPEIYDPLTIPRFEPPQLPFYVDHAFESLQQIIQEFESNLDQSMEIGLWLTTFGTSTLMQVRSITYKKPCFICFSGLVNGQESELVQHMGQINFLLTRLPKKDPNEPVRTIGFTSPSRDG